MDYTFSNVNQASAPLATFLSMKFGHASQHILQCIAYWNPVHGPPLMAKIDLADGYYCILLSVDAAL